MILANKYFSVINNYFLLTKPRVQTLLVFSSLSGAFLAERGAPNIISLVGLLLGGYFAAGGSSALNMYFEKDIDKNIETVKAATGKNAAERKEIKTQVKDLNAKKKEIKKTVKNLDSNDMASAVDDWFRSRKSG